MTLCGTGHRPNKLGGYGDDAYAVLVHLAVMSLEDIKPDRVISGMALGWDMAIAEAAIRKRILLIAAIPFEGQESMWPQPSKDKYRELLDKCAVKKVICSPGYAPYKMQARNQWMVDNSNIILALWNGTSGGTANCVKYAEKRNVKIFNLWNVYEKLRR